MADDEDLGNEPLDTAEEYYMRAQRRGPDQYEAAIADYDKAIELNPNDWAAYNNRAGIKDVLGRYEEALEDYDKAAKLQPNFGWVYSGRASVRLKLKQYEEAVADYTELIKRHPKFSVAYVGRGNAKAALKQYDSAIADYDEAIECNPDYAEAYNDRGVAKAELGQYEAAIADFDKAIGFKPDYADAIQNRAAVISQKAFAERGGEALQSFQDNRALLQEHETLSEKRRKRYQGLVFVGSVLLIAFYTTGGYWIYDSLGFSKKIIANPFSILPYIVLLVLVSSPLIYLIRLWRADANREQILYADYFRRLYIENMMATLPNIRNNPELRNAYLLTYLESWAHNSTTETLLAFHNKSTPPKMHLLEDLATRLTKRASRTPSGEG